MLRSSSGGGFSRFETHSARPDRVLVVDLGGPGAPFEETLVRGLLPVDPDLDVLVYSEPWTLDRPAGTCQRALEDAVGALLEDHVAPAPVGHLGRSCRDVQQSAAEYRATFSTLDRVLQRRYGEVAMVGFSFGASRLRAAQPVLATTTRLGFVEPGPSPLVSVSTWAPARDRGALERVGGACRGGAAVACTVLEATTSEDPARAFEGRLAALYLAPRDDLSPYADLTPSDLARLSVSADRTGSARVPGAAFLAGLCAGGWTSGGRGADGAAFGALLAVCPAAGPAPGSEEWNRGGACLVFNSADPLTGPIAVAWSSDPVVSDEVDVDEPDLPHGGQLRRSLAAIASGRCA